MEHIAGENRGFREKTGDTIRASIMIMEVTSEAPLVAAQTLCAGIGISGGRNGQTGQELTDRLDLDHEVRPVRPAWSRWSFGRLGDHAST